MKSIRIPFTLVIVGVVSAHLSSCNGPEPNPCAGKKPISADFIVGETFFGTDTVINCDTLRRGKSIAFKALGFRDEDLEVEYDSYEWKVGNDPRVFTRKAFSLLFRDMNDIQTLTVTLTVKDQFLADCFGAGGHATLTKQFVLVPRINSAVFGEYEGALDERPTEKFIVSVLRCYFDEDICTKNINKGCDNHANPPLSGARIPAEITYRTMFIDSGTSFFESCDNPKGWLYFGSTINDVIIEYTTGDPANRTGPRRKHRFTGKRIR